jgi:intein-encoded DNA endonuclease-like protein
MKQPIIRIRQNNKIQFYKIKTLHWNKNEEIDHVVVYFGGEEIRLDKIDSVDNIFVDRSYNPTLTGEIVNINLCE